MEKNPALKAAEKEEFYGPGGVFEQSDLNCDFRIDLAEFRAMRALMYKNLCAKHGDWCNLNDDEITMMYNIYNCISKDDGITREDFLKIALIIQAPSK